jgi:hypothetical protein
MFACCFLIPRAAQARGVGTDYFLVSPEHGEWPDGAAEKNWRLLVDSTARRHAKLAAA